MCWECSSHHNRHFRIPCPAIREAGYRRAEREAEKIRHALYLGVPDSCSSNTVASMPLPTQFAIDPDCAFQLGYSLGVMKTGLETLREQQRDLNERKKNEHAFSKRLLQEENRQFDEDKKTMDAFLKTLLKQY